MFRFPQVSFQCHEINLHYLLHRESRLSVFPLLLLAFINTAHLQIEWSSTGFNGKGHPRDILVSIYPSVSSKTINYANFHFALQRDCKVLSGSVTARLSAIGSSSRKCAHDFVAAVRMCVPYQPGTELQQEEWKKKNQKKNNCRSRQTVST